MDTSRTAIVTGASSGVGEATAIHLAELGIGVALIARRAVRIERLAAEIRAAGGIAHALPADLSHADEAEAAMQSALGLLGNADVLVYAAGTNVRTRRVRDLSVNDWDAIVGVNLSGAFYCTRAVLPSMRSHGRGLFVLISSVAASRPSVLSGAAYSASKAGLNALAACIDLEEASNAIRACVIEPGNIDTELLDRRPEPPTVEQRAGMLRPEDSAVLVGDVIRRPPHVLLESIRVRPWSE
jgi:NADP-dependent 3-hydroxy acid dehydrogenase YdfG